MAADGSTLAGVNDTVSSDSAPPPGDPPGAADTQAANRRRPVPLAAMVAAMVFVAATATLAVQGDGGGGGAAQPPAVDACATGEGGGGGGSRRPPAKRILACVSPSLAFVRTPTGSGSGILVDGHFVVTNAHVVDPFAAVSVVFAGGERHDGVAVMGVDLTSDIAVVGPVDTRRRPLALGDGRSVEKGDDLFLVGYPGEVDDEPEPTVSRGILSRTRRAHGLTFLQSDAAIAGGQSGGAVVDARGDVVGVSGFSFAEEFALALSGADTRRSLRRVLAGDVPPYRPFPEEADDTSGTFRVDDTEDAQVLTMRTRDAAQVVRLTLDPSTEPVVMVSDLAGEEVFFRNQAALDAIAESAAAEGREVPPDQEADPPVAPGVFEFEVPEDTYAVILVGTRRPEGAEMAWSTSVPVGFYEDRDDGRRIDLGTTVHGEIEGLESRGDTYVVDLEAGDVVEVHASSATGDVGYFVRAPGERLRDVEMVDDSDVGLWGTDAREEYEADTTGPHRVTVVSSDGTATAYVLMVRAS